MTDATSPPAFEARIHPRGDSVVVALRGDADLVAIDAIDTAFDLAATHPGPIVADLAELEFLDSSGLRALVQANSRISSQGRRFALACPDTGRVRTVLELTQLHRIVPVHPDRETAARALRG